MDLAAHVDTAAFAACVGALAGLLVPRIIERVPEPEPDEEPDGGHHEAEHVEGADDGPAGADDDAADDDDAVVPASSETVPLQAATQPATQPPGAPVAAPTPEPDPPETDPPETKLLYTAIADSPGLAWKCVPVGTVVGGLIGLSLGWAWALLVWLPLVPVGLALAVIDWRTRLLPTWLIARVYVGLVVLLLVSTLVTGDWQDPVRAGIGWAGAGLLFFVLWYIHPRGLGYGDVRLSGILGLALGYVGTAELVVGVYAGFLLGGVGGGLLSALRLVERKGFPFGPFMLVGAVFGLVAGDWVGGLVGR